MRGRIAGLAALAVLVLGGPAWAADPVAYITEIQKKGAGEVRVRVAGESEWKAPRPLLALRPGDQLQVQGDVRVVVLFHAGGGTKTVTAENSPFTVASAAGAGGGQLKTVTSSVSQFLLGKQDAPQYRRLSTRGLTRPPLIIAPRHTRVLPTDLRFEWEGGDRLRYTVRLVGPQGTVWEQRDLPRQPLDYPVTAPPLTPGVPYRWELEAPGHPVERSQFEVLSEADAARVRSALAALDRAEGYSPGTLVVMRTALLFEEGLYNEARRQIEAAVAVQPDEPNLRLLQGHVYQRIGLNGKAADAFDLSAKAMR
ncbi:MAG: tetratricopeptide repeat protein [Candidatus Rokuibacteriota bacterium]